MSYKFNPFTGNLDLDSVFNPQVTVYYVDQSRTDIYVPNGSIAKPFLTFADANAAATASGTHDIAFIILPGVYAESIVLNNANYQNVEISAIGYVSFISFSCVANNDALTNLIVKDIAFGSVDIESSTDNNACLGNGGLFIGCTIGYVTAKNIVSLAFQSGQISGDLTLQNIVTGGILDGEGHTGGLLSLATDTLQPMPDGLFGQSFFVIEGPVMVSDASVDAASELQYRNGCRIGYPGGTLTVNGILDLYNCFVRSDIIVNSGGLLNDRGNFITGAVTVNAGGTRAWQGSVYNLLTNGAAVATNATLVNNDGHVKHTQTTVPTTTVSANAGTGASAVLANATDNAGQLALTFGSGSFAPGEQVTVNFNLPYNVAPIVMLTPTNARTAQDGGSVHSVYVTSTVNGFSINLGTQQNNGGLVYAWNYLVIETQ